MVVFKEHQLSRIRQRNRVGLYRESEGFILPFEGMGQHNPVRGKEPCFVHATKERRMWGLLLAVCCADSNGSHATTDCECEHWPAFQTDWCIEKNSFALV